MLKNVVFQHPVNRLPEGNMAKLGINVDHVATLRQARGGLEPDPVTAAALCELAGADSIVAHLREDRRHIQDRDLALLRERLTIRLDMEMAATAEMVDIAVDLAPDMATLVPEKRRELTTEGGLDVRTPGYPLEERIQRLKDAGIAVSLFVEPDGDVIKTCRDLGTDFVEIHTGAYANARGAAQHRELARIGAAITLADALGMGVNVGHGLNYANTHAVTRLGPIAEFNIGHSVMARAILVGIVQAVRDMRALIPRDGATL